MQRRDPQGRSEDKQEGSQPREVHLAREANRSDRETGARQAAREAFHPELRARVARPRCLSRGEPDVTRTMSDSVWTEGKPQSPPQHLSSMAAAMFDSWMEPVTSRGGRPIRGQGREEGTPGPRKRTQRFLLPKSSRNVFITPVRR